MGVRVIIFVGFFFFGYCLFIFYHKKLLNYSRQHQSYFNKHCSNEKSTVVENTLRLSDTKNLLFVTRIQSELMYKQFFESLYSGIKPYVQVRLWSRDQ